MCSVNPLFIFVCKVFTSFSAYVKREGLVQASGHAVHKRSLAHLHSRHHTALLVPLRAEALVMIHVRYNLLALRVVS